MKLTVLFDPDCGLCWRARRWLSNQRAYVKLEFVGAGSELARRDYPELDPEETRRYLHVVADDGRVWKGAKAWAMCLWALRRWRGVAMALRSRSRLDIAQRIVMQVSERRYSISRFFGWTSPAATKVAEEACEGGSCELP